MIAFAVMNAGYITTITGTVIARDDGILKRLTALLSLHPRTSPEGSVRRRSPRPSQCWR
jgi:hypothetical protein